jgi:hypothetical protein
MSYRADHVAAHASQSAALPRLRRRLGMQTDPERLRWLC